MSPHLLQMMSKQYVRMAGQQTDHAVHELECTLCDYRASDVESVGIVQLLPPAISASLVLHSSLLCFLGDAWSFNPASTLCIFKRGLLSFFFLHDFSVSSGTLFLLIPVPETRLMNQTLSQLLLVI